jgi:protoporphyrinogen oxidase
MSIKWVADRVSQPQSNAIRLEDTQSDWGANNSFAYPMKGGFGNTFNKMSSILSSYIHYNSKVIHVDPYKKRISLANGEYDEYDMLINTIPLDTLVNCMAHNNPKLIKASEELLHTSVCVIGIGIKGAIQYQKSWVYFPDDDCPFFRITYLSNYSPHNTPDNSSYYSLLCEISLLPGEQPDTDKLVANTVQGLILSGIINHNEQDNIVSTFTTILPYAYPVPTLMRDNAICIIQDELESLDIYSRGRFGAWKYEVGNTDHSFMQGKELVDCLFDISREYVWHE